MISLYLFDLKNWQISHFVIKRPKVWWDTPFLNLFYRQLIKILRKGFKNSGSHQSFGPLYFVRALSLFHLLYSSTSTMECRSWRVNLIKILSENQNWIIRSVNIFWLLHHMSFQLGWKQFEFWYYLRSFQLGLNMNKNFEFQY